MRDFRAIASLLHSQEAYYDDGRAMPQISILTLHSVCFTVDSREVLAIPFGSVAYIPHFTPFKDRKFLGKGVYFQSGDNEWCFDNL